MTHIKTAIRDAIKDIDFQHWVHIYDAQVQMNGNNTVTFLGDGNHDNTLPIAEILLSTDFWKCLGKNRGWAESKYYSFDGIHPTGESIPEAQWYSRVFWNHLWKGGTAESFFASLEE